MVGITDGIGVQVGGRRTGVQVDVGTSIVGGNVAGGNGFRDEVGSLKMEKTTMMMTTVANNTIMERMSHIFKLIFMTCSPLNQGCSIFLSFVSISDFESMSS
jgi:hypothetical protein